MKSVEKRVTKAIRSNELKIEVLGKRPTHSGGLLVRLNSKKNAEILEKAVKVAEELKDKVQCTVSKLRRPRNIIFDVPSDIEGSAVIAATAEQANVEVESMSVKFPMRGKDLMNWVLECPSTFHKLLGLRRLIRDKDWGT